MEVITAHTGEGHVTSGQFRAIISSMVGEGSYIANIDEELQPELSTDNTLKIRSGVLFHHGHIVRVPTGTYDTVTYKDGIQGEKRIDLVVARYVKDAETNKETTDWVVIQGTSVASDPQVPHHIEGNMQNGYLKDDCPVFQITYDGLNVLGVKKLLPVAKNLDDLSNMVRRKVLYNNVSGTTTDFRISDVITNYDYIEIFYNTDVGGHTCPQDSIKLPTDLLVNDQSMLFSMYTASLNKENNKYFQIMMTRLKMDKDSMVAKFESSREINIPKTAGSIKWEMSTTMHHRVYRVIGYKIGF